MIFYDKGYLKYFKYEQNMRDQREYSPRFPFLKHLQRNDPSFVSITKPLKNKLGDAFGEGLT